MKISAIYQKYNIMPSLQTHMFRVAGVAQMICESMLQEVDQHAVVSACLLHDMGNIIKFKLDMFPEFLEPEGLEYWRKVKDEYVEKYGTDEHVATLEIAKEIGVSERVMDLLLAVGFSNGKKNFETEDFGKKIAMYSDMRVEPHGVVSLQARLEDGLKRFHLNKPGQRDNEHFREMSEYLGKIEKQIFKKCAIKAEDIIDEEVEKRINSLKELEI